MQCSLSRPANLALNDEQKLPALETQIGNSLLYVYSKSWMNEHLHTLWSFERTDVFSNKLGYLRRSLNFIHLNF